MNSGILVWPVTVVWLPHAVGLTVFQSFQPLDSNSSSDPVAPRLPEATP